jgi:fatty-acyl-CoA synthase
VTVRGEDGPGSALKAWTRALERTAPIEREPQVTLPMVIERLAGRFGAAPALVSPEASLSYGDLAALARRYSRWALAQQLGADDVVCLLMNNCAEYLAIWLGLTRVGVTVALINTHLAADGLAHALRIVAPKHVVAGAGFAEALQSVRAQLPAATPCWLQGRATADFRSLDEVHALSGASLDERDFSAPTIDARALYIYTSGTTGLPKAATVSHYRLMQWSHWFAGLMDTRPEDRMYNCLPLYHSVGGVVATGATLVGGGAVVLRRRFSATEFWREVCAERCTLFQYIGELCRFLVNRPPEAAEREHPLRLACGNGLRPEVWKEFAQRFRIPRILEYYAATEGNFSLYNCEGEPGAIGRIPPFLAHRLPVALVRFDVDSGAPLRNAAGFCERCAADEAGEAIGFIPAGRAGRTGRFEGYADAEASSRKVLHDVFKPGDRWYRTGDLMRRDARGFYYFVDRVGDTFRWKGENVATGEVQMALCACRGVLEAVAYGVRVPGSDGRAGMAALVVGPGFDLQTLRAELESRLPEYARPVFLRIVASLEATGTFKPKKQELQDAGFDPARVADALYFDDRRRGSYVALDARLHAEILAGGVRV